MIDVISPLTSAKERTLQILFRPFVIEKWVVLAFASFLIQPFNSFFSGGGSWPGTAANTQNGTRDYHAAQEQVQTFFHNPFIILICAVAIGIGFAIGLALSWLSARGQFMLLDNIVRNRAIISEPWRVFGAQANRLWLFNLALGFCYMAFTLVLIIPPVAFICMQANPASSMLIPLILYGCLVVSIYIPLTITLNLILLFMPPIMYRNGVSPWIAFKMAASLIMRNPGSILLMIALLIALALGLSSLMAVLAICTLCLFVCVLYIPFISSVVLLPLTVFFRCYLWDVLAQYGPEYNVWEGPMNIDLQRRY